jgi:hypothetical protein
MMKKILLIVVVLALVVPSTALAAVEFSLGGFIKLDSFWGSSQQFKNIYIPPARSNDLSYHHGRMFFTAQGSRFNFTIKGPKLWGAQVTGFLEMDFDPAEGAIANTSFTASNSYTPRLRHAMFRLNWPETELLFGQYWSMFCEWYAETAEDGPFQSTGTPTARLAQVRVSQKFAGAFTAAALIGEPNQVWYPSYTTAPYSAKQADGTAVGSASPIISNGQSAESPQVQGKLQYQQDLWGKAAYYGKPIPFTAQVVAGWQRNVVRGQTVKGSYFFDDNKYASLEGNINHQYLNPWLFMGSLFIPVIPTHSANLAGTASILTQWWIGQGVEAFGFTYPQGNILSFDGMRCDTNYFEVQLLKRYGGFIQGQYYFNNQWFLTGAYAVSRAYGVNTNHIPECVEDASSGSFMGLNGDQFKTMQQFDVCLWYRPIQAIKFGLQYSWARADYFQKIGPADSAKAGGFNLPQPASYPYSDNGSEHRVEFVGYFFF